MLPTIFRKDPWSLQTPESLLNLVDDEFSDFFDRGLLPGWFYREEKAKYGLKETKDNYKLSVAIPGIDKDKIDITVNNSLLTIKAKREEEKGSEDEKHYRKLQSEYSFQQSFSPQLADLENIKAKYNNGVLEVIIPKNKQTEEESKAKHIPVE